jgi:hypothetical protein
MEVGNRIACVFAYRASTPRQSVNLCAEGIAPWCSEDAQTSGLEDDNILLNGFVVQVPNHLRLQR